MKNSVIFKIAIPVLVISLASCGTSQSDQPGVIPDKQRGSKPVVILHPEWNDMLKRDTVEGSIHILDFSSGTFHHSDSARFTETRIPASTFKIFASLMALEHGIVKDENEVLKWDGNKQHVESWNHDQDMKEAFANSTNWFYERICREIGEQRMKEWLDKAQYGCNSIDGKEKFWLEPGFELSPEQQIDFLIRLHDKKLPFSDRSQEITKNIMFRSYTAGVSIYAKTGWGMPYNINTGWYVGWAEKNDSLFYFAACIEQPEPASRHFGQKRIDVIYKALGSIGVIKDNSQK